MLNKPLPGTGTSGNKKAAKPEHPTNTDGNTLDSIFTKIKDALNTPLPGTSSEHQDEGKGMPPPFGNEITDTERPATVDSKGKDQKRDKKNKKKDKERNKDNFDDTWEFDNTVKFNDTGRFENTDGIDYTGKDIDKWKESNTEIQRAKVASKAAWKGLKQAHKQEWSALKIRHDAERKALLEEHKSDREQLQQQLQQAHNNLSKR